MGYSESLPRTGCTGCGTGQYSREHNPWVDFTNVPAADGVADQVAAASVFFVLGALGTQMKMDAGRTLMRSFLTAGLVPPSSS